MHTPVPSQNWVWKSQNVGNLHFWVPKNGVAIFTEKHPTIKSMGLRIPSSTLSSTSLFEVRFDISLGICINFANLGAHHDHRRHLPSGTWRCCCNNCNSGNNTSNSIDPLAPSHLVLQQQRRLPWQQQTPQQTLERPGWDNKVQTHHPSILALHPQPIAMPVSPS